ncbi:hypothetical protein ACFP3U_20965, partial [Kitasatospora misakiensis]
SKTGVTQCSRSVTFANSVTGAPGPGGYSHHIVVAKGPDGSGGSFDVSFWRRDATTEDDTALRRIAETVLPTLQGWVATTPGS